MAQERNKNLDTMLLFATLFSAIVTAFIVESTNLLEQDSSEISTQLLLMLVRSQQRIETEMPNSTSTPAEIPKFVPSAAVRLINVLWFASLVISLGAAVVAILAKEWLGAFTSYRTRHSHKYALERQVRLASMVIWNMRPIIDLLPTLLNIALFIFGLGLIVRLWLLDFVVAGIITTISTLVCAIYSYFVFAGALCPTCPYKSQLSYYLQRVMPQRMLEYFNNSKSLTTDTPKILKSEEIDLLTWFLSNSSDPMLGSYVTQALAGLKSLNLGLPVFPNQKVTELREVYMQNNQMLGALFSLGAQAIDQLRMAPTRGRNELAYCGGSNVARLAIAMSEIYPYALTWKLCASEETMESQTSPSVDAQGSSLKAILQDSVLGQTIGFGVLISGMDNVHKITDNVFDALDLIWTETSPALTPSAYAYLATAELKMLRQAFAFLSLDAEQSKVSNSGHNIVEMGTPIIGQARPSNLDQESLQERCSRALSRAALIIKSSYEHLTSKGGQETQSAIADLLLEATKLVEHMKPTSNSNNSLCRFGTSPSSHRLNEEISITVITKNNTLRRINCKILARNLELMESLVELSRSDISADALRLEGFRVAAFNLLLTFWPVYLRQSRIDEDLDCEFFPWEVQEWKTIPLKATYDSQTSAEIIIYQTIVLTYVATSLWKGLEEGWSWKRLGRLKLFQLTVDVLFSGSSTLPKITTKLGDNTLDRKPMYRQWLPTNETLEKWIHDISDPYLNTHLRPFGINNETSRRLSWCIACLVTTTKTLTDHTVDIFARLRSAQLLAQSENVVLEDPSCGIEWAITFIYAASQASGRDLTTTVIRDLLGQVTNYIKEVPQALARNAHLRDFAQGKGFDILTKLGRVESDHEPIVGAIMAIMDRLHAARLQVGREAVPLLLEAMSYACDAGDRYCSNSFVGDVLFQFELLSDGMIQSVTPNTLTLIQKVLDKLEHWERETVRTPRIGRAGYSDRIASLKELVQQCICLPPGGVSDHVGRAPLNSPATEFSESQAHKTSWGPANQPSIPTQSLRAPTPHLKIPSYASGASNYQQLVSPTPVPIRHRNYISHLESSNAVNSPVQGSPNSPSDHRNASGTNTQATLTSSVLQNKPNHLPHSLYRSFTPGSRNQVGGLDPVATWDHNNSQSPYSTGTYVPLPGSPDNIDKMVRDNQKKEGVDNIGLGLSLLPDSPNDVEKKGKPYHPQASHHNMFGMSPRTKRNISIPGDEARNPPQSLYEPSLNYRSPSVSAVPTLLDCRGNVADSEPSSPVNTTEQGFQAP
ncbi:unnamed protein product [Rhizoctonia solani]|uniref:DUF6535 domain-containing protein n=1 Tax=Rhizoctonia solani TaxID=456999 RepID=A0A8H3GUW8_9AGAM|nr:unnamed protein product [Rhizoctonia solani]